MHNKGSFFVCLFVFNLCFFLFRISFLSLAGTISHVCGIRGDFWSAVYDQNEIIALSGK